MGGDAMPWFRMYREFASDPVIQAMAFEDQRHFVMLLCLKCDGVLDKPLPQQVRSAVISRALGLDIKAAQDAKLRLMDMLLIDDDWQPLKWSERQFESDSSTDRVRAYRKRMKNNAERSMKRNGNVPVTAQETDTDTEKKVLPNGSTGENSVSTDRCPYQRIVDLYHETLPMCPRVTKLTGTRKANMRQRWRNDLTDLGDWGAYLQDVRGSPFLTGQIPGRDGRPPFVADLDWLIKPANLVKVQEGKYHRSEA